MECDYLFYIQNTLACNLLTHWPPVTLWCFKGYLNNVGGYLSPSVHRTWSQFCRNIYIYIFLNEKSWMKNRKSGFTTVCFWGSNCQWFHTSSGNSLELNRNSTTICKLVDLIPALHQSDCRIPNWVSAKTVHSSSTNHGQTTTRFRPFFR